MYSFSMYKGLALSLPSERPTELSVSYSLFKTSSPPLFLLSPALLPLLSIPLSPPHPLSPPLPLHLLFYACMSPLPFSFSCPSFCSYFQSFSIMSTSLPHSIHLSLSPPPVLSPFRLGRDPAPTLSLPTSIIHKPLSCAPTMSPGHCTAATSGLGPAANSRPGEPVTTATLSPPTSHLYAPPAGKRCVHITI